MLNFLLKLAFEIRQSIFLVQSANIQIMSFKLPMDSLKMILAMDLATFRQKKWQDLDLATSKKQNKIT